MIIVGWQRISMPKGLSIVQMLKERNARPISRRLRQLRRPAWPARLQIVGEVTPSSACGCKQQWCGRCRRKQYWPRPRSKCSSSVRPSSARKTHRARWTSFGVGRTWGGIRKPKLSIRSRCTASGNTRIRTTNLMISPVGKHFAFSNAVPRTADQNICGFGCGSNRYVYSTTTGFIAFVFLLIE